MNDKQQLKLWFAKANCFGFKRWFYLHFIIYFTWGFKLALTHTLTRIVVSVCVCVWFMRGSLVVPLHIKSIYVRNKFTVLYFVYLLLYVYLHLRPRSHSCVSTHASSPFCHFIARFRPLLPHINWIMLIFSIRTLIALNGVMVSVCVRACVCVDFVLKHSSIVTILWNLDIFTQNIF